jgi:hypothetical protein
MPSGKKRVMLALLRRSTSPQVGVPKKAYSQSLTATKTRRTALK